MLAVFSPPRCGVVIPTPAYPPFFEIVELSGREPVAVPMIDDATLDLDGSIVPSVPGRGPSSAGPTPLGVATSGAAYRDGGEWLDALVANLDGNRRFLVDRLAAELPGVAWRVPEATFRAWLDCSALGIDDPAGFFLERARCSSRSSPRWAPLIARGETPRALGPVRIVAVATARASSAVDGDEADACGMTRWG